MALTVRDIPDADVGNDGARCTRIVTEALTPDHQ
jgi:hypothetical protein